MKRIQAMRPDKKFQIDPQKRNTSKTHESTPQQRKERQQQRPNKQGEKRKIKPKTNLSFPTKNNLKSQIRCYHDPKASQNNLHTQSSPKKETKKINLRQSKYQPTIPMILEVKNWTHYFQPSRIILLAKRRQTNYRDPNS